MYLKYILEAKQNVLNFKYKSSFFTKKKKIKNRKK